MFLRTGHSAKDFTEFWAVQHFYKCLEMSRVVKGGLKLTCLSHPILASWRYWCKCCKFYWRYKRVGLAWEYEACHPPYRLTDFKVAICWLAV